MQNNDVTVCMIVKNEDQFVWYAIEAVLPYVKEIIVWDTGSSDKTVEIIKSFRSDKISFADKRLKSSKDLSRLRQEQFDKAKSAWVWIIDGDEVYPENTIFKILDIIKNENSMIGVIIHRYDLIGDIYHSQDESVGEYNQFGKKGHYALRLINKKIIPGLKVLGDYPKEYFTDSKGVNIKTSGKDKFTFVNERIFHAMYLKRSSKGANLENVSNRNKWKIELGEKIPKKEIPAVFFLNRQGIVDDQTSSCSLSYFLIALLLTPIKKIKRKIVKKREYL